MLAYVLASFIPGHEKKAFEKISNMDEVKDIHLLFGEWDVIAKVEVTGPSQLEEFIIEKIRTIDGINLTSTMIVAK